jgi:hypothetical protein
MTARQASDRFIGFVDLLGFSQMVRASERGSGPSLDELLDAAKRLGDSTDTEQFTKYGPPICPAARRIRDDLDFQLTQVSDGVVVSSEVSPAGVINIIGHCWRASMSLLTKGFMCRGYIKRGLLYHKGQQLVGSGFQDAYEREKQVSAFAKDAEDQGTPFIEVDGAVVEHVGMEGDDCVKEMFSRMTMTHAGLTALFPFKRVSHSFAIGPDFDALREKAAVQSVRQILRGFRERVLARVDQTNPNAVRKGEHYIRALDEQLAVCDKTDQMIDLLGMPFPRGGLREE